jgi:putative ABC transport system substrate-binding protein
MRVAILFNPETAPSLSHYLHSIETAAPTFGVELLRAPVRSIVEIEAAIAALGRQAGDSLICLPDSFLNFKTHRELIIALAARYNVPAVYPFRLFVADGGLMSYGVDMLDLYRRAASYVDRILKGEKPADLPVQQPTKYELVLNLKTARALGLDIPPMLRALADEVVE